MPFLQNPSDLRGLCKKAFLRIYWLFSKIPWFITMNNHALAAHKVCFLGFAAGGRGLGRTQDATGSCGVGRLV